MEVVDALGRAVRVAGPQRIVSLVPSETLAVVDLGARPQLVGRTDYCILPSDIHEVTSVGGTKGIDVGKVRELEPDLVLANKEENSRKQVEALIAADLPVHVSFPKDIEDGLAYLLALATLLDTEEAQTRAEGYVRAGRALLAEPVAEPRHSVFVPIWKAPWMTFAGETYADAVLNAAGATNAFAGRVRRYPLAADLGVAPALAGAEIGDRDIRYPRTTLEEVRSRGAELCLLPDEPYEFGEADRIEVEAALGIPTRLVSGIDLFWYGTPAVEGVQRLRTTIRSLEPR